jgi:uncharacterized integral membrane protein
MPRKLTNLLHTAMTNQFVILAVAILLFLLVIILVEQTPGDIGEFWI